MNILRLKKMGMDFYEEIESDLENYRLRLFDEIITKDGKKICGDIFRGMITNYINNKAKHIRNNGLAFDLQYDDENGNCYRYSLGNYKESYYTKEYLLKKINEISVIQYDAVEILN